MGLLYRETPDLFYYTDRIWNLDFGLRTGYQEDGTESSSPSRSLGIGGLEPEANIIMFTPKHCIVNSAHPIQELSLLKTATQLPVVWPPKFPSVVLHCFLS